MSENAKNQDLTSIIFNRYKIGQIFLCKRRKKHYNNLNTDTRISYSISQPLDYTKGGKKGAKGGLGAQWRRSACENYIPGAPRISITCKFNFSFWTLFVSYIQSCIHTYGMYTTLCVYRFKIFISFTSYQ